MRRTALLVAGLGLLLSAQAGVAGEGEGLSEGPPSLHRRGFEHNPRDDQERSKPERRLSGEELRRKLLASSNLKDFNNPHLSFECARGAYAGSVDQVLVDTCQAWRQGVQHQYPDWRIKCMIRGQELERCERAEREGRARANPQYGELVAVRERMADKVGWTHGDVQGLTQLLVNGDPDLVNRVFSQEVGFGERVTYEAQAEKISPGTQHLLRMLVKGYEPGRATLHLMGVIKTEQEVSCENGWKDFHRLEQNRYFIELLDETGKLDAIRADFYESSRREMNPRWRKKSFDQLYAEALERKRNHRRMRCLGGVNYVGP